MCKVLVTEIETLGNEAREFSHSLLNKYGRVVDIPTVHVLERDVYYRRMIDLYSLVQNNNGELNMKEHIDYLKSLGFQMGYYESRPLDRLEYFVLFHEEYTILAEYGFSQLDGLAETGLLHMCWSPGTEPVSAKNFFSFDTEDPETVYVIRDAINGVGIHLEFMNYYGKIRSEWPPMKYRFVLGCGFNESRFDSKEKYAVEQKVLTDRVLNRLPSHIINSMGV